MLAETQVFAETEPPSPVRKASSRRVCRSGGKASGANRACTTRPCAKAAAVVGVWLAPEAVGRGLVTRAVRHMIDWAVGVRGMERVEWRTVPANERSVAVARRLGMTRDGVLRSAAPLGGTRHDLEVWALLASDWHAAQATRAA